jgi:glycosyltransferase involved in cell wall biosynthesis
MTVHHPQVTVILPIRNEARYIAQCLDAVLAQTYPRECLEILIVDGMSDDGTREIVNGIIAKISNLQSPISNLQSPISNLQLLDNPHRIVPTALNRGIQNARGEIIIRVDGHCVIARDYVERCMQVLHTVEADCVGGAIETLGETFTARAIALAQSSPFGVGGARFRYSNRAGYVDTLAFGAYRRKVFDRIGLFDEELVRNQDDEFNLRLTRAGGKIWLDPHIKSVYYSRGTLCGLWKQYFEYGFWKVRVMQKHGRPASLRHLVPAIFVLALGGALMLSLVTQQLLWVLLVALPYLVASFTASLVVAARHGWRYAPLLPFAFATMHLAYGIGFLRGIVHFIVLQRAPNSVT